MHAWAQARKHTTPPAPLTPLHCEYPPTMQQADPVRAADPAGDHQVRHVPRLRALPVQGTCTLLGGVHMRGTGGGAPRTLLAWRQGEQQQHQQPEHARYIIFAPAHRVAWTSGCWPPACLLACLHACTHASRHACAFTLLPSAATPDRTQMPERVPYPNGVLDRRLVGAGPDPGCVLPMRWGGGEGAGQLLHHASQDRARKTEEDGSAWRRVATLLIPPVPHRAPPARPQCARRAASSWQSAPATLVSSCATCLVPSPSDGGLVHAPPRSL